MSKFLLPKYPFLPQYKNKNDEVFKGKNKYFGQIFTISSDRTADQRLCFRYIDSTAPIRNFKHQTIVYMAVQPGLCLTWSENPKTCFVVTWLIYQSEGIITNTYTMSHFTRKLVFCICKNQELISLPAQAFC